MKYGVILADPPWSYTVWKGKKSRTADAHYDTMTHKQIARLRPMIDQYAADNCALFLWSTPPTIDYGLKVIEAWGFRYISFGLVWEKTTKAGNPAIGMGHYTRANVEPCLLAIRGRMPVADKGVSQVIRAPRRAHSQKPDEQYERIERLYPDVPKIELFARQRHEGWDTWGDEVTNDGVL